MLVCWQRPQETFSNQESVGLLHEEADTRMLLHAIHADKTFGESGIKGRIIVKSPDTDVLILCIHYFPSMQHTQELWFHTGSITTNKVLKKESEDIWPLK
jgi:hypothetical protein